MDVFSRGSARLLVSIVYAVCALILAMCVLSACGQCNDCRWDEQDAGTVADASFVTTSWNASDTTVLRTTTHVFMVRGRLSARIGAPVVLVARGSGRWIRIDGGVREISIR
jgi:hypothetical protein